MPDFSQQFPGEGGSIDGSGTVPEVDVDISKPSDGDLSADGVGKVDLTQAKSLSGKPSVMVKRPKKGIFGGLLSKPVIKENKVEAPPVSLTFF